MKKKMILTSSQQSHECDKPDCYFCYYMKWQNNKNTTVTRKAWSPWDEEFLATNHGKMSYEEIEKILGRTRLALRTKVYKLSNNNAA